MPATNKNQPKLHLVPVLVVQVRMSNVKAPKTNKGNKKEEITSLDLINKDKRAEMSSTIVEAETGADEKETFKICSRPKGKCLSNSKGLIKIVNFQISNNNMVIKIETIIMVDLEVAVEVAFSRILLGSKGIEIIRANKEDLTVHDLKALTKIDHHEQM